MLQLIFQPRCVICQTKLFDHTQPHLCRHCHQSIRRLQGPSCTKCLQPFEPPLPIAQMLLTPEPLRLNETQAGPQPPLPESRLCGRCLKGRHFDKLYAYAAYDGGLALMIQEFKFGKKLNLSGVLGSLLASHARRHLADKHYDRIIPVPLHNKILRKRGFNHAQQLSRYVRDTLKVPQDPQALSKHQHTPEQVRLSLAQREKNLSGAFVARDSFHGETCLIVDDVYTSGTTVDHCARVLKAAGALRVDVLTLARTL